MAAKFMEKIILLLKPRWRQEIALYISQQEINAKKKIAKIANQHLPTTTAVVNFQEGIPSMPLTTNNIELLKNIVKQVLAWAMVRL